MNIKMIITLLFGAIVFGVLTTGSLFASQDFKEEKAKVLKDEKLANSIVQLIATNKQDSKEINVNITFSNDNPSLNELEQYRNEMPNQFNMLAKKGHDKIPVTISMKEALSAQEFENFVTENGLEVEKFEIRVIDEHGIRATLGGRPEGGDIYPEQRIKEFLGGSKTIKGVYLFKGKMPVKQELFDKLHNDNRVFVVDVSEKVLEEKIKNSPEYKQLGNDKHLDINLPNNFYWKLEDLKIAK
ncbi:hypothetical protein ACFO25_09645 [Paenactinomyces guangxiensis]|uniref:Uncharacterized protein n=1 Tax=Paenactinomyces guangxiensis TaxID=1490290 RepID=A0A7W2A9N1_9BACL|nr:hypothetical protein [Paenactinomyces guangxiensis]MBA4495048.1 hypothetical protein [Paenactinomyces guangxiensis]MBH8592268.1 hypothetical protein [Paenactinomyces guangxiensis]